MVFVFQQSGSLEAYAKNREKQERKVDEFAAPRPTSELRLGNVRAQTIFSARMKLNLAYSIPDRVIGAIAGLDEKAQISRLEDMGYADGKLALLRFSLDNSSRYVTPRKTLEARLDELERAYNAAPTQALKDDIGRQANLEVAEGTAYLFKIGTPYFTWAAADWAKNAPARFDSEFLDFVDAHSYISYLDLAAMYSMKREHKNDFLKNVHVPIVEKSNPEVDRYYAWTTYGCGVLPGGAAPKDKETFLRNYKYNLEQFEEGSKRYLQTCLEKADYAEGIRNAKGTWGKLYAASKPYLEASVPLFMALTMLNPYTAGIGYGYFAGQAIDAFREGRNAEGALISLTLLAPGFGMLRGVAKEGIVAAGEWGLGSGIIRAVKAANVGAAGMEYAGHAAGYYFQFEIAKGMYATLDGAKYGMSPQMVAKFISDAGFLMMPAATRAGRKKGAKAPAKENAARVEPARKSTDGIKVRSRKTNASRKAERGKGKEIVERKEKTAKEAEATASISVEEQKASSNAWEHTYEEAVICAELEKILGKSKTFTDELFIYVEKKAAGNAVQIEDATTTWAAFMVGEQQTGRIIGWLKFANSEASYAAYNEICMRIGRRGMKTESLKTSYKENGVGAFMIENVPGTSGDMFLTKYDGFAMMRAWGETIEGFAPEIYDVNSGKNVKITDIANFNEKFREAAGEAAAMIYCTGWWDAIPRNLKVVSENGKIRIDFIDVDGIMTDVDPVQMQNNKESALSNFMQFFDLMSRNDPEFGRDKLADSPEFWSGFSRTYDAIFGARDAISTGISKVAAENGWRLPYMNEGWINVTQKGVRDQLPQNGWNETLRQYFEKAVLKKPKP